MLRKTMTIPADLHMEILKYLPPKSLMRFRCVSKTWNCIIRNPKFAKLHQTISRTRLGATTTILFGGGNIPRCLYFCKINHQREAIHELTIDTSEFGISTLGVTKIVNGLVCFWIESATGKRAVRICNITTHEVISLPTNTISGICSVYSLGYDPLNCEYKVLCIKKGREFCKCMVFTIWKDKEWRDLIDVLDINLQFQGFFDVGAKSLYHDGAIYWLSPVDHQEKQKLVVFNVREEKFWTIDVPDVVRRNILKLVRIGGRIVLYTFVNGVDGADMFVLEECIWVHRNIQVPSGFYPIGNMENKVIFLDSASKELAYDPNNNGDILRFELNGLDRVINDRTKYNAFPRKISIDEIVENIYPLKQNYEVSDERRSFISRPTRYIRSYLWMVMCMTLGILGLSIVM